MDDRVMQVSSLTMISYHRDENSIRLLPHITGELND
jgi:hypothetical protein